MAEEAQYASATVSANNKRKYDDQTPPPSTTSSGGARRTTGFSAPTTSQSPDTGNGLPSYNSVPPPLEDFELAKQRAQEIAARFLLNTSAEAKRPRVDNGFDSNDNGGQKPLNSNVTSSSIPFSYGQQGSKKIDIPNGRVGVIIGKAGETIKYLQQNSGAKIQVTRDMDADPNSPTRSVELVGTPDQIAKAEQLINDVLNEAEAGGSGIVSRRLTGHQYGSEQFVMQIPNNKVGLIIGKGGETIKNMQANTGARIQVIPLHLPPGDTSTERTLHIDGNSDQIEAAKQLVNEVISENRLRNPSMTGRYPQQGYQAQPPNSWAPPGPPMQQPGYGYMQPGAAYPAPSPQYNMSQPPYTGYPQPASGGYATGWDQTTGAPNQQTSHGGGYDYYNQQSQQQQAPGSQPAPADNTGYGYTQPPASGYNPQGQGYSQDGYSGYHAPAPQPGYGQPQSNPIQGYDGYGNVTNPTPEGHTPSYGAGAQGDTSQVPAQGYNVTQQPSPNSASYPPQGSTQPGYGAPASQPGYGTQPPSGYGPNYGTPQAQKPPVNQSAYVQPQQSPSAQGGYAQPVPLQPGYPLSQPAPAQAVYAQPDSGAQRAPPSSYGTATTQPGYGAPPYGALPVAQSGYGQQPPPYNSSYAAGYSQPPAYTADGNTGGSARGTYDAAPTSQAAQSGGVAKASPQS